MSQKVIGPSSVLFTIFILENGLNLLAKIFWMDQSKLDIAYGKFQFRQMKFCRE